MTIPIVSKYSPQYLKLRIKGGGKTGKADRCILLSASEAKMLAYTLMIEAERLSVVARVSTKAKLSN